ncbi:precorrin-6y C5,15-methyltransferase (decarboxylating) subunit CbiE [Hyphomicrobium sp.]|uniref:precorrin-6y C5,15-methyltransferase (decarboxylating) subunit CbiE n=1 Tax=Hyphomicrobium sp. TaxID=82 RepID=UPI0025C6CC66|nr:precorrin-6y C5,15-methyltransferase (decarboxylating) subunit CbiE [Hyphomicrobium sp.]MCC7252907.1 precorrin-6y C5,15-methyltransferase (decarboxylating) subunit CbiE [Hyphomicrobium sp.]
MGDEPLTSRDRRWLSLIGIGEDGLAGLSDAAKALLQGAELVVGGKRHLMLARDAIHGKTLSWPSPLSEAFPEISARRGRPVAVLASGDPFFYGVGKQIVEVVPVDEILCLPQPSAFSLAAARLGWPLQDCALVTLHGRPLEAIIRHLQPGGRILALSWDGETPARLAKLLAARGFGAATLTILEALGGPRERVRTCAASDFALAAVDSLNTVAIVLPSDAATLSLAAGLDDSLFESDGQLTKREIRAVTLSSLAPRAGELLWDVGLGAGSIAIEWLLRHPAMRAIGIEERVDRAERAARNAAALGTPDLRIVTGRAPEAFSGLPAPDAVFLGGGMGDAGVFEAAWAALKPGGRLVANAVALRTEQRMLDLYHQHGGDLVRLDVARASPIGNEVAWSPARPVTQWRARKPC